MDKNTRAALRQVAATGQAPDTPSAVAPAARAAQRLQFSTNGIPSGNRLELWEHHNAKALLPLDIRTIDDSPLRARELSLRYGSLRFAGVRGSAQVVERNERFIRQHPTGVVAICFALEGETFFFHRDGNESLKPGQAIIYDADLPFMRGFSKGLKELVLTIPRDDYMELSGGTSLVRPQVVDFNQGTEANQQMRALARLVSDSLAERVSGDPVPAVCPEGAALDMLGLLASGGRGGPGPGHLFAARNYIEEHLHDPGLDITGICSAIGVSERQLSRIFAAAGEPPASFIRERRLGKAREVLIDPVHGSRSVGRIAGELGFASQSYFTRAFKARFGIAPLALRREALGGTDT
ncbi:AraC family transcriptional regulator [Paeniglutamicibacter gangotriensis]|uniref:AraC family transcriptional regulator n=1 Tax=Paeniglutamicibacter gangotriensis TaxID=254787 RepID=UPI0037C73D32